jgi:hypothetical protein
VLVPQAQERLVVWLRLLPFQVRLRASLQLHHSSAYYLRLLLGWPSSLELALVRVMVQQEPASASLQELVPAREFALVKSSLEPVLVPAVLQRVGELVLLAQESALPLALVLPVSGQ